MAVVVSVLSRLTSGDTIFQLSGFWTTSCSSAARTTTPSQVSSTNNNFFSTDIFTFDLHWGCLIPHRYLFFFKRYSLSIYRLPGKSIFLHLMRKNRDFFRGMGAKGDIAGAEPAIEQRMEKQKRNRTPPSTETEARPRAHHNHTRKRPARYCGDSYPTGTFHPRLWCAKLNSTWSVSVSFARNITVFNQPRRDNAGNRQLITYRPEWKNANPAGSRMEIGSSKIPIFLFRALILRHPGTSAVIGGV